MPTYKAMGSSHPRHWAKIDNLRAKERSFFPPIPVLSGPRGALILHRLVPSLSNYRREVLRTAVGSSAQLRLKSAYIPPSEFLVRESLNSKLKLTELEAACTSV